MAAREIRVADDARLRRCGRRHLRAAEIRDQAGKCDRISGGQRNEALLS
jgi:hypothetical protein